MRRGGAGLAVAGAGIATARSSRRGTCGGLLPRRMLVRAWPPEEDLAAAWAASLLSLRMLADGIVMVGMAAS